MGADPEIVEREDQIRIGHSLLTVRGPDRPPASATVDGAGHLRINRRPHLRPPRVNVEIRFPPTVPDRPGPRIPWLALLLPLLLAVPMAVIWRQPTLLLFTLMTPVMMAGQYLADRRSGRRETALRQARYQDLTRRRRQNLEQALAADAAQLERSRPDLARLLITATTPTDELWPRSVPDGDFLLLRLGRGREPSSVTVYQPPSTEDGPHGGAPERPDHPDVPVAVDLVGAGVLGICGPRRAALGLARSLIGQLAVLHSPHEVRVSILTADPGHRSDWQWATWLPHHDQPGSGRPDSGWADPDQDHPTDPDDQPPRRVIVMDGVHGLRHRPEVATLLRRAAQVRGSGRLDPHLPIVLCLDRSEQDLPMECGSTVVLDHDDPGGDSSAVVNRRGTAPARFVPDQAGERWAERLSRALAPLRDATPVADQGLPCAVGLIGLLTATDGVRPTDPDDLVRHWQRARRSGPTATLGVTGSGVFRVDLRRDGPHLLVGGTTGAGKSELLQTLVAALAVDNSPEAISFLLVDYKGGAAFRECAGLPHIAGMITDLDPHLARRALTALTAELRRRERLLHAASAADIDEYQAARLGRADRAPIPRLVVIVDEFRVLAEELPEFISGLVRTATVGRSLGVHLVLATQRPTGVVSAEISANVNLRIALRVRDGGDSRDLIDDPGAARLPTDRPGRALARSGSGALVAFQTARVSGHDRQDGVRPVTVRRLDLDRALGLGADLGSGSSVDLGWAAAAESQDPGRPVSGCPNSVSGRPNSGRPDLRHQHSGSGGRIRKGAKVSDLSVLTESARAATHILKADAAQSLWIPPLPNEIQWDELRRRYGRGSPGASAHRTTGRELPFAVIDRPREQRQDVLAWPLAGTHLAVTGGPRSGRTTTLLTLARAAATEPRHPEVPLGERTAQVADLHLYGIDGAGGLSALRTVSRVEAVIAVQDSERVDRLLRPLSAEIDARQGDPSEGSAGRSRPSWPDIVLLIDGWEALTSHWSTVDHGRPIDQLTAVLRDGPAVGVVAAISGGRNLMTGAVSALLSERVVLRFADPADAVLAGVPSSRSSGPQPAGRGLVIGPRFPDAAEIQVALGEIGPPGHVLRSGGRRADPREAVVRPPVSQSSWQIPELPRRLEHHQLLDAWQRETSVTGNLAGRRRLPIGIGGDEARVLELDLDAAPITLVVGPAGSGRTSVLRCLADGLSRLGEPGLWVRLTEFGESQSTGRPNPAGSAAELAGQTMAGLAAELAAHPTRTVLVDDTSVAGIPGSRADELGDLIVAHAGGRRLVIATSAPELLGAYRGLLGLARTSRSGLFLSPGGIGGFSGQGDLEVFGLRPERRPPGPPGRALLVQNGRAVSIQLALPPRMSDDDADPVTEMALPPEGKNYGHALTETGQPPPVGTNCADHVTETGLPPPGDENYADHVNGEQLPPSVDKDYTDYCAETGLPPPVRDETGRRSRRKLVVR